MEWKVSTWCGGGAPHVDLLVRLDNAAKECLKDREIKDHREDRKKDNEIYHELIVDVMYELDISFPDFNDLFGMAMHRQVLGHTGSCMRHMRALVYKVMKRTIKKKRDLGMGAGA